MRSNPKTIEELLVVSGVGLKNSQANEEIKQEILTHGYTEAKINEILAIHTNLEAKYQEFEHLSGLQLVTTTEKDQMLEVEMSHYSFFRQMIAKAFSIDEYKGLRSQLGIDKKIRTRFAGFVEQAGQFYEGAAKNQEILKSKISLTVELSPETIQTRLDALSALLEKNGEQESIKGRARVARNERDEGYRDLRIAWENFKISCRTLFKTRKEYLTILNIKPKKKPEPEVPKVPEVPEEPPATPPPAITALPLTATAPQRPAVTPAPANTAETSVEADSYESS
jgi:hypothetical protein